MHPLVAVPVDVVGNLRQQNPLPPQDPERLKRERRVHEIEVVALLFRRLQRQAEAGIEVLGAVLALVRDMRRIVDDHVKAGILERHVRIVANHVGLVRRVDVHADDLPLQPPPETAPVDGGVENVHGGLARVEVQHLVEQFGIVAKPDGRKRVVAAECRAVLRLGNANGQGGTVRCHSISVSFRVLRFLFDQKALHLSTPLLGDMWFVLS